MKRWMTRAAGSLWVRLLIKVALLTGVALEVDCANVDRAVVDGNWTWLGAAVAMLIAALGAAVVRWHAGIKPSRPGRCCGPSARG
jgi:hypothetical protein